MNQAGTRIAIVTPVFNDWASLVRLLAELDRVAGKLAAAVTVLVVDDGSIDRSEYASVEAFKPRHIDSLEAIFLRCNLGHERAIAVGLAECLSRGGFDQVVVMDCDGEDNPDDIVSLLDVATSRPDCVVVAQRAKRSEGIGFSIAYFSYRCVFRLLTGRSIDFGNFCVLPGPAVARLCFHPETWSLLAAAVVRSNLPITRVPTVRGVRYAGRSSMNGLSLVVHGFAAISVFADRVLGRMVLGSCAALAVVVVLCLTLSLVSDSPLFGWVGPQAVGLVPLLALLVVGLVSLLCTVLAGRARMPFIAAVHGAMFIESRRVLVRGASCDSC